MEVLHRRARCSFQIQLFAESVDHSLYRFMSSDIVGHGRHQLYLRTGRRSWT